MDDDIKWLLKVVIGAISGALLIVWVISFALYKYDIEVASANIIKVYVGEEKVYEGKKAFVMVDSGGMTTTITIYKKLYPISVIDRVYSDNNIRIGN